VAKTQTLTRGQSGS